MIFAAGVAEYRWGHRGMWFGRLDTPVLDSGQAWPRWLVGCWVQAVIGP